MKKTLIFLLLSLIPILGEAQDGTINRADTIVADHRYIRHKTTRKVGAYITDIYNLNSAAETFSVEFRAWSYGPREANTSYSEFPHAKNTRFTGRQVILYRDSIWEHVHVSSTYTFDWDMSNFPFDTQTLRIEFENSIDRDFVELKGDVRNSGVAADAIQSGYRITDVRFFDDVQHTGTTFGNPLMGSNEECDFSCYVAEIDIARDSPWTLFLKIFSAVIVSFFIATITFMINPRLFDARLSLTIGALFAAVGSKFVVDSLIGMANELTLVDRIYILTYAMIFVTTVLQLISHKVYQDAAARTIRHFARRRLDCAAFFATNLIYIVTIWVMVARA